MKKLLNLLKNYLESETLVPNNTRLKPSVPNFAKYLLLLGLLNLNLSASLLDFKDLSEAKEAYSKKEYDKAQQLYSKVQNDEAIFNEADALYRQKKYKEAIEKYESVKEPSLEAKKLHNIGNSYAQMNKLDEAIKSYEEALKIADDEDTKYNLELLKKKKEEQKKKQQQKKNQDKKNNKDDKKNNKDKKDQKNQDKKQSEKDKQNDKKRDSDKQKSQEQKDKEKKEAEEKKQEEQKKKEEEKMKQAMMGEQNKTQPPISNMEERKWQKMLNQRGVNTLMIPLQQGERENETNPW